MRRRWRRWQAGIRGRLLVGFLMLFVLALSASGVITAFLVNDYISDRSVDKLREDERRITALVRSGPQTINSDQFETMLGPPLGVMGLDEDGDILFAIGTSAGREYELARLANSAARGQIMKTSDDVVAVLIATPGMRMTYDDRGTDDVAQLILVNDVNVDRDAIVGFVGSMAAIAFIAVIVLMALALVVLQIGLRPLSEMAQAADAIAEGSRDERLPVSDRNAETDVLAAAVNRAFDAQARAEDRARTFAADASHELRTPLATISGWLELYRQGGLSGEDVEQAVARIEDEVGRIRLLVEELGLLARLDTGLPLDSQPLDLARLAESVVEDARVIYSELDITFAAPPDGLLVRGDAARLQQVLRNLVGNAVQHNPPGTQVRLTLHHHHEEERVDVIDNGTGIPAADIPRLFDRFWRAEASRSRDYGGSGLGLAIVQAIVRAHGGRITVNSAVGHGTTVTLYLPTTSLTRAPITG
ncbi:HAMP domain-containing sensor histidine kinase [Phytohabitans flavus]|uniref:histidine kinase n=1 Tax=Phytohabitans flavus TaxID=1076124 RepID=A0A6F8XKW2_9ACTN|nr:HAMP domain-containing sensor histidine kinase [Phytohabitans flavus]BCB74456.1 two-component sensor histidine kinase [Phytohabitans flavus]